MLKIRLRPYQIDALEALKKDFFERKHKRLLISVPTGGGKTVIFNSFAYENSLRTLVIAHREELLTQAVEKYLLIGGKEGDTGFIKQGIWEEKPYTAGSIQTLVRHLDRLNGKAWDLVVVDEAHHTMAETYQKVLNRLMETNPGLKILGATATPFRSDDKKLKDFYEKISYSVDIVDLIKWGYLVPFSGKRIYLEEIDLDKVSLNREGDFSLRGLSALFNDEKVIEKVVEEWLRETGGEKKTIFFAPSIEVSLKIRNALWRRGIAGEHIDGSLSPERRREIISLFRQGKIIALTNVNVLTEGFDDPSVEVIANLRPTRSKVLYIQIVGRALRPFFGKEKAYILDFTGVSKKYSVAGLHLLFDLPPTLEREYLSGRELEVGKIGDEVGFKLDGEVYTKEKEVVKAGEEEFSYEGRELQKYITQFGNRYILTCGFNKKLVVLEQKEDGTFEVYISLPYKAKEVLYEKVPYDYAFAVAETIFNECKDEKADEAIEKMVKRPLSDKQINFLTTKVSKFYEIDLNRINNRLEATNIIGLAINDKLSERLSGDFRYQNLFLAYFFRDGVYVFPPSLITESFYRYLLNRDDVKLIYTGLDFSPYLVSVPVRENDRLMKDLTSKYKIQKIPLNVELLTPEAVLQGTGKRFVLQIPAVALEKTVDFSDLRKTFSLEKREIDVKINRTVSFVKSQKLFWRIVK